MKSVSVVEAKAHLSELIDKVEAGEQVVITRHGKPVARLSPEIAPKQPFRSLAEFRARMPKLSTPLSESLRAVRDEERY